MNSCVDGLSPLVRNTSQKRRSARLSSRSSRSSRFCGCLDFRRRPRHKHHLNKRVSMPFKAKFLGHERDQPRGIRLTWRRCAVGSVITKPASSASKMASPDTTIGDERPRNVRTSASRPPRNKPASTPSRIKSPGHEMDQRHGVR